MDEIIPPAKGLCFCVTLGENFRTSECVWSQISSYTVYVYYMIVNENYKENKK